MKLSTFIYFDKRVTDHHMNKIIEDIQRIQSLANINTDIFITQDISAQIEAHNGVIQYFQKSSFQDSFCLKVCPQWTECNTFYSNRFHTPCHNLIEVCPFGLYVLTSSIEVNGQCIGIIASEGFLSDTPPMVSPLLLHQNIKKSYQKSINNEVEKKIVPYLQNDHVVHVKNFYDILSNHIRNTLSVSYLAEELEYIKLIQASKEMLPHFIFNTLNLITATAYFEGAPKTEKLMYSLSDLLRYTLNLKNDPILVSLKDEIKILKDYLFIQSQRFGSRLQYELNINSEVLAYRVPVLTIQPIVENAILHSFLSQGNSGKIVISVDRSDDYLVISVADSGNTLTQETFELAIAGSQQGSIGMYNTHYRIQQCFGMDYGLKFIEDARHTIITIRIPIK